SPCWSDNSLINSLGQLVILSTLKYSAKCKNTFYVNSFSGEAPLSSKTSINPIVHIFLLIAKSPSTKSLLVIQIFSSKTYVYGDNIYVKWSFSKKGYNVPETFICIPCEYLIKSSFCTRYTYRVAAVYRLSSNSIYSFISFLSKHLVPVFTSLLTIRLCVISSI